MKIFASRRIKINLTGFGLHKSMPFSLFLLLFTIAGGSAAAEPKVLALRSAPFALYEPAVEGFEQTFGAPVQRIFLNGRNEKEILQSVRKLRPDLVLAVGRDALALVRQIKTVPVVYCMVLNPQALLVGKRNFRGVSMNLRPEKQMEELLKVLPNVRNINLLYDPEKSGAFVQRLRQAAARMDVKLAAGVVHRSPDVPRLLNEMKGRTGVFWMLPDTTVITPETLEYLFLFSLEARMPVLAFSDRYLELGAMLSIRIDPYDIGCQAGELARRILYGHGVVNDVPLDARKAVVAINEKVAGKLGVTINPMVLKINRSGH